MTSTILNTDRHMMKGLTTELLREINQTINHKLPLIQNDVHELIKSVVNEDRTVKALRDSTSELVAILGIPYQEVNSRVDEIVQTVADNSRIRMEEFRFTTGLKGFVEIGVVKKNYRDLLRLPAAKVELTNGFLNIIEWLCLKGGDMIVDDWTILYRKNVVLSQSRSQHGLMIKTGKGRVARIPPGYQGIPGDSFLERAFLYNDKWATELNKILFKLIQ